MLQFLSSQSHPQTAPVSARKKEPSFQYRAFSSHPDSLSLSSRAKASLTQIKFGTDTDSLTQQVSQAFNEIEAATVLLEKQLLKQERPESLNTRLEEDKN